MNHSNNRRKFRRLPKKSDLMIQKLSFSGDNEIQESQYKDVSGGGLLFDSQVQYDIGTILKMELQIPGWGRFIKNFKRPDENDNKALVAVGEVVRVEEMKKNELYEIGIKFVNIFESDHKSLMEFIDSMYENI